MYSRYMDIGSTYMELLSNSSMSLPTKASCSVGAHLGSGCRGMTKAVVMRSPLEFVRASGHFGNLPRRHPDLHPRRVRPQVLSKRDASSAAPRFGPPPLCS